MMLGFPEPEILYASSFEPDVSEALDVLAFLLVPERAFMLPGDDIRQLLAIREVLHDARRDALLRWYAAAVRRGA